MSSRDYMYKSRTGNHSSIALSQRERTQEERRQQRTNTRMAVHTANRRIEPTPKKVPPNKSNVPALTGPRGAIASTSTASGSAVSLSTASTSTVTSQFSRQQAFKQKFKEFKDKKAAEALKKRAPFVSAVSSGRFIERIIPVVPKLRKTAVSKVAINDKETKFSPINTRSRNRELLSPSQLPTPRRKSRSKSANAVTARAPLRLESKLHSEPKKVGKPTPQQLGSKPKIEPKKLVKTASSTNTRLKPLDIPKVVSKTSSGKPVSKPMVPKPGLHKKPAFPIPASMFNGPAPISLAMKSTQIPSEFQFNAPATDSLTSTVVKPGKSAISTVTKLPSVFSFNAPATGLLTSTAVKPRKSATVTSNSSELSGKILFDESVSPIETIIPTPLKSKVQEPPVAVVEKEKEKEELNITPQNIDLNTSANYVSPFVTISRGSRGNKTKEQAARESKYTLNSRRSILNDSQEDRQNQEAAQYFRLQMKRETDRLLALVDKWIAYKEANAAEIPSDYIDVIDVAIGQTRLLTTNKFQQFRVLVDQCEQGVEIQPVRPEDLEGFWNMVYMQVENCDKRFSNLDKLMANNWEDPDLKNVPEKKKTKGNDGVTNSTHFKTKSSRSNSVLAKMLKAAKKQFKENKLAEAAASNDENGKSLLTDIQNETSRRVSTPQKKNLNKSNIWVVEDEPRAAVPTPAKSILKTPGSTRKGRSVLFLPPIRQSPRGRSLNKENGFGDA